MLSENALGLVKIIALVVVEGPVVEAEGNDAAAWTFVDSAASGAGALLND